MHGITLSSEVRVFTGHSDGKHGLSYTSLLSIKVAALVLLKCGGPVSRVNDLSNLCSEKGRKCRFLSRKVLRDIR